MTRPRTHAQRHREEVARLEGYEDALFWADRQMRDAGVMHHHPAVRAIGQRIQEVRTALASLTREEVPR